jgi:lysophospholipase L1-like esterase
MKKLILILLILLVGCKGEPLDITLTSPKNDVYVHSILDFNCNATNGKEPYIYEWNVPGCFNEKTCTVLFEELGNQEIICKVKDKKDSLNKSVMITVNKIPKKMDHVVGLGDSLTYGKGVDESWIELYSKDLNLHNYAITGATSYSVESYQWSLFEEDNLKGNKLVFLWFGTNDIKNFISIEEFKTNYISVLNKLSSLENTEVILITIPDVSKLSVAEEIEDNLNDFLSDFGVKIGLKEMSRNKIIDFNFLISDLALEYNLNLIDMFVYMDQFDESLISSDKFHPNEEGHIEISKVVSEKMDEFYWDYEFY